MYMRNGLGQSAGCPSVEQLMGISDINDPCQLPASAAGIAIPSAIVNATLPNVQVVSPSGAINTMSLAPSCPAGSTCSLIAGVPNTAIYLLGGILGVVVLMGVLHK